MRLPWTRHSDLEARNCTVPVAPAAVNRLPRPETPVVRD